MKYNPSETSSCEALELSSGSITVSQFVIVFTNYGHPSRLNTNFQTKIYTSD
jgi:hypothetical protein